jgi:hypothetical protein
VTWAWGQPREISDFWGYGPSAGYPERVASQKLKEPVQWVLETWRTPKCCGNYTMTWKRGDTLRPSFLGALQTQMPTLSIVRPSRKSAGLSLGHTV